MPISLRRPKGAAARGCLEPLCADLECGANCGAPIRRLFRRAVVGERAENQTVLQMGQSPGVRGPTYSRGVQIARVSDHVLHTVERERELVAARLLELRGQASRVRELADGLDSEVETNARLLRQMDELLGYAPQLSLDGLHGDLRGRRLQEIAVQVLRDKRGIGAEVHYREWYQLLVEAGARVAGKDPLASFLTQVSRAPGVESVRPRSGIYRLRTG
jgi:hypothetical protein